MIIGAMIIGTVVVIAGRPMDGSMMIFSGLAMIKQVSCGFSDAAGLIGGLSMMVSVIGQVAALTERP